jgi:hypothetical protein
MRGSEMADERFGGIIYKETEGFWPFTGNDYYLYPSEYDGLYFRGYNKAVSSMSDLTGYI